MNDLGLNLLALSLTPFILTLTPFICNHSIELGMHSHAGAWERELLQE
jgi:hypothetical protein